MLYKSACFDLLLSPFEWVLNQKAGKRANRRYGTKHKSSLGTCWRLFCLVYERVTGNKIKGKMNRGMHEVLDNHMHSEIHSDGEKSLLTIHAGCFGSSRRNMACGIATEKAMHVCRRPRGSASSQLDRNEKAVFSRSASRGNATVHAASWVHGEPPLSGTQSTLLMSAEKLSKAGYWTSHSATSETGLQLIEEELLWVPTVAAPRLYLRPCSLFVS